MPIIHFTSPLAARQHAIAHPWDHHAIVTIQDGENDYHLRGLSHYEWTCATGGDFRRWCVENNVVAWDVFDTPRAEKPSFEAVTTLLNPSWQRCHGCGGFHPVTSEC
jgi:hypothetical protein